MPGTDGGNYVQVVGSNSYGIIRIKVYEVLGKHTTENPISYRGTDHLSNCVLLCINKPYCHQYLGHDGNYSNRVVLCDEDLSYLYIGR